MSILHIDSITKSFGRKDILKDIFLAAQTGKITGLLGRNGAGKSTLLQIIFGTLKSNTQYIKFNNKILTKQSDRKSRIAYLPQHSFLPKNLKIRDFIKLFCTDENLEKALHSALNRSPKTLSGGELRLAETLLIIYSDAEFVLLDEPFHSLSPKIMAELKNIIKEECKNKGFIISDHNFQDVLEISDEVYLLSEGHLKHIKDMNDLKRLNYLPKNI